MGNKGKGINGALLADDMGLGKTIQTIALAWTLVRVHVRVVCARGETLLQLRQGPRGLPVARRVSVLLLLLW
jgi:SNF2 family DNA or RNA helicase